MNFEKNCKLISKVILNLNYLNYFVTVLKMSPKKPMCGNQIVVQLLVYTKRGKGMKIPYYG
jgi:hypothetical protein